MHTPLDLKNAAKRTDAVTSISRAGQGRLFPTCIIALKKTMGSVAIAGMLAAMVVFLSSGCQSPAGGKIPEQAAVSQAVYLGVGDVVKLSFPGSPEFTQSQRIRSDGKLNLALVGEVTAAGKKLRDFQSELSRLYKPQLLNTEVIVTLESSATPVVISGAVTRPGKIMIERPVTVLEAIMEAGGISPAGDAKRVHLIRVVNGEHHTQVFDLSPLLSGKTSRAFYVKGGDVIYVPQSIF
ncbi:MAG: polysaccharide export protein [Chthoniobacteraceae bacterium]|nr:polysaccharide export protein [Chthoniobacteraceae bacterium]